MSKTGPIIIIDDDPDDQEMISRVIAKMNLENPVIKFYDGEEALHYFQHGNEQPFLTLCDINMPLMNGIELKENIQSDAFMRRKSFPFVYLTTTAHPDQIKKAYTLMVQGFFVKGQSYDELKETLIQIVSYWRKCSYPTAK
jgi:CheY-like chemotaxis protein